MMIKAPESMVKGVGVGGDLEGDVDFRKLEERLTDLEVSAEALSLFRTALSNFPHSQWIRAAADLLIVAVENGGTLNEGDFVDSRFTFDSVSSPLATSYKHVINHILRHAATLAPFEKGDGVE